VKLPEKKCVKQLKSLRAFDKRSFRYVPKKGGGAVMIGCPKGQFSPKGRKKLKSGKFVMGVCKVGTRGVELIEPMKGSSCRVGYKRR
jgi:hypothetical protein